MLTNDISSFEQLGPDKYDPLSQTLITHTTAQLKQNKGQYQSDLLPITYKCIRLQLQLLYNFMITDYNYIFPECNQLQLHCNVIDYNYNYFLVVPCLKKF